MKVLFDILRGIVIGVANIIPGVSGGTMAVSMGIYDKLIGAVNNLFKQFKKSILFLLPLLLGMGLGIVGFGKLLDYLLEYHVLATSLTFVGLILGGLPILWANLTKSAKKKPAGRLGAGEVICFVLLLAAGVGLSLLQGSEGAVQALVLNPVTILVLFLLGVVASATMVIPGVSGSMVLMVLGYYSSILALVTGCLDSLVARDWAGLFHNVGLLIPFGIGVVLGIFLIAKLIDFLFRRFPSQTYAAIIGLIVSSPFAILYSSGALAAFSVWGLVIGLILGVLGAFVTLLMGRGEKAEA